MNKFNVGDIVSIDKEKTLGDLFANHWSGCQIDTLKYLRDMYDGQSKVTKVFSEDCVELDYDELLVNANILKLIPIREMTKDEIEKELGCKIKII